MLGEEIPIIELMLGLYYKHREIGGVAVEFRLSPRRFSQFREFVRYMIRTGQMVDMGPSEDGPYLVLDIPVRIDERLPPTAMGIHGA